MITDIQYRNFKNLRHVDLKLGRFTVLVGPNGCGKTSALQGLHLLSQLGLRRPGEASRDDHRLGALFSGRWHPARLAESGSATFSLAAH